MVAAVVEPERPVFLRTSASEVHLALSGLYGYAPEGGERLRLSVPRRRGKNTTVLSSTAIKGMGPSPAAERATTVVVFEVYVQKVLTPSLRAGEVVAMDDILGAHRPERIWKLIEARDCEHLYLPGPRQGARGFGRSDRSGALGGQRGGRQGLIRLRRYH